MCRINSITLGIYLFLATTSSGWSFAVLVLVILGHFFIARDIVSRLHSGPLARYSHRVFSAVTVLVFALVIACFFVLVSKVGMHGPRVLRGGDWSAIPTSWVIYIALCLAAVVFGITGNLIASNRREPSVQTSLTTRREDLAKTLGRKPAGTGLNGCLARLPGNELFEVDIIERHLRLPQLPQAWRGLSILHLSDTHFNGTPDRTFFEKATELANELRPDLIALTGDVLDTQSVGDWLPTTFGRMHAPLGCYFVLGNHDVDSQPDLTRAAFANLGWVDVAGRCETLDVRGHPLVIGGSERPWMGDDAPFPLQATPGFRLLLSHTPIEIHVARKSRVDLMLAGHLHGGQICIPLLGPLKSGPMIAGIYDKPPTVLHLSRGLGVMSPLRWRCRPEMTKIVLE